MWKKFNPFQYTFLKNRKIKYKPQNVTLKKQLFVIRQIEFSDMKALLDVERLTYAGETPWTKSAFLAEIYSRYPHLYLAVIHEGEMIGFMGVRVFRGDAHITNIALIPAWQNFGLGAILMAEAEKFAYKNRCQTMSLEVRIGNKDAQRFYRRLDFVSRKVIKNYYTEENEDAIDMVKYL